MKKLAAVSLTFIFAISLWGCCSKNPTSTQSSDGTSNVPSAAPSFHVEITPLYLPTIDTSTYRLVVMDSDGTRILYSLNRSEITHDQMHGYFITDQVVLYDAAAGQPLQTWIPETPGYYYAGAIGQDNTAVLAGELDYTNTAPQKNGVYLFGNYQKQILSPVPDVNYFHRLADGSVIFSFADQQRNTGVCQVKDGNCNEILVMATDEGSIPYAGVISSHKLSFSHVMNQNGLLTLSTADTSGVQLQHTLEYEAEKLDSCCLTESGLLACLSVNEGTTSAYRSLVLYNEEGKELQLRISADSPLYRMCFGHTTGIAVNNQYQLHLIGIAEDHVACTALQSISDQLEEYDKSVVFTFSTGDGRNVLYFRNAHKLFLLDVRYE